MVADDVAVFGGEADDLGFQTGAIARPFDCFADVDCLVQICPYNLVRRRIRLCLMAI